LALFLLFGSSPTAEQDKSPKSHQPAPGPPAPTTITTFVNNQPTEDVTKSANQKAPNRYDFLRESATADWALVLVGTLTGLAVWRQAVHTKAAAQATRDSVAANERHFKLVNQQWLDTQNWRVLYTAISNETLRMDVWCEVANPTTMAVTLTGFRADSLDTPIDSWVATTRHVLPPRRDYPILFGSTTVATAAVESVKDGHEPAFTFVGEIRYVDAFDQPRVQAFGRLCKVMRAGPPEFTPFDGSLQQHHAGDGPTEKQGQPKDQP
jgi:hypothetical protein